MSNQLSGGQPISLCVPVSEIESDFRLYGFKWDTAFHDHNTDFEIWLPVISKMKIEITLFAVLYAWINTIIKSKYAS